MLVKRIQGDTFLAWSSRGGLEVELCTDNSLPSASVDQILLGATYLYGTIWTRYIYNVYRCVLYVCVGCKAAYRSYSKKECPQHVKKKDRGVDAVQEKLPSEAHNWNVICKIYVPIDWNIDHRGWSKKMSSLGGPTFKRIKNKIK